MTTPDDTTRSSVGDVTADVPPSSQPASARSAPAQPGMTFETLAVCGFIFGLFAMVASVFALGLAARTDNGGDGGDGRSEASDAATTLDVSLIDFGIVPEELNVPAGSVLNLSNDGAVIHNLAVDGVSSEMIDPAASGQLDLTELAPGSYTMICEVPGHEAAGMKGTLSIE